MEFNFGPAIAVLAILALLGVTFGVWKLVEIIVWVWSHLHWS